MSIRNARTAPATEADVGKYAVRDTVFRNGFCSRPVLITKVSKSRVYFKDSQRVYADTTFETYELVILDKAIEEYMRADSLIYICDFLTEAQTLHSLSEQQHRELTDTDKAVRQKYKDIVGKMLT